jgi:hypothetical protein
VALQFGDVLIGLGKMPAYLIAIHSSKDGGGLRDCDPQPAAAALSSVMRKG